MSEYFMATVVPNGYTKTGNLSFSVCIDINHNNAELESEEGRYKFYKSFIMLPYILHDAKVQVTLINNGETPVNFENIQLSNATYFNGKNVEDIRKDLWERLFKAPSIRDTDNLKDVENSAFFAANAITQTSPFFSAVASEKKNGTPLTSIKIESMRSSNANIEEISKKMESDAAFQHQVAHTEGVKAHFNNSSATANKIDTQLASFGKTAKGMAEAYKLERDKFIDTIAQTNTGINKSANMFDIMGKWDSYYSNITRDEFIVNAYMFYGIDINEIICTYSRISHHLPVMRILNLISDFEIPITSNYSKWDEFAIKIEFGKEVNAQFLCYETQIVKTEVKRTGNAPKTGYLVKPYAKTRFKNSILLHDSNTYLLNFDITGQEYKIKALKEKTPNATANIAGAFHDSFTRGIIYNRRDLPEIITPLGSQGVKIYEEHIVMGNRVAMKEINEHKWVSITKRSTRFEYGEHTYEINDQEEASIHFDHITNDFNDQTGQMEYKTSEALFEFKGELLTLNTIFSRAKASENDPEEETVQDPSLENSDKRIKSCLLFDYFPFKNKALFKRLRIKYGLPTKIDKGEKNPTLPKLTFGNSYGFVVYNQYKNGWGIPLFTESNDNRVSIFDLINDPGTAFVQNYFPFKRLENAKPVLLFPQNEIKEEAPGSKESVPLSDRESINHLIVRNEGPIIAGDTEPSVKIIPATRHVLPARISLEHAYWYGLLFKMQGNDRWNWKCRYNCSFKNASEFKGHCEEGCKEYCGGTAMKANYPKQIRCDEVNYIPDPVVDGFTIQLFWDKDCTSNYYICSGSGEAVFQKAREDCSPGSIDNYRVNSYTMHLIAGKQDIAQTKGTPETSSQVEDNLECLPIQHAYISVENSKSVLKIILKPGMTAYARVFNHTADQLKKSLFGHDYWINQLIQKDKENKLTAEEYGDPWNDPKNPPLKIQVTHAVQKPIVDPRIYFLSSHEAEPSMEIKNSTGYGNIEHVVKWIQEYKKTELHEDVKAHYEYLGNYIDEMNRRKADPTAAKDNLDKCVIGLRPEKDTLNKSTKGSTLMNIEIVARIERLDAVHENLFLQEAIPTGELELWMRKEEFIDNPGYLVLDPSRGGDKKDDAILNHIPDEPVLPFYVEEDNDEKKRGNNSKVSIVYNEKNEFSVDNKIAFTASILKQLKTPLSANDLADCDIQHLQKDTIKNPFTHTISRFNLLLDAKTTKFEEREYYIRNYTKYRGYFTDKPRGASDADAKADTDTYSRPKATDVKLISNTQLSARFKAILLNNDNPSKPEVQYAVTTIAETRTENRHTTTSKQRGNIVTVYLKRGRLTSGKDERVGIFIYYTGGRYFSVLNNPGLISKVGRDIISDLKGPRNQYLLEDQIVIPDVDENVYDARFDKELGMYHFLPQFDIDKQLWKFEVHFNIKDADGCEMHNPFIQLSMVHYQPFSINYARNTVSTLKEMKQDCRLSEIEVSTWCHLLPERNVLAVFSKPFLYFGKVELEITLSCDTDSLNFHQNNIKDVIEGKEIPQLRSNFIIAIEGSNDRQIWVPLPSAKSGTTNPTSKKLIHPLLNSTTRYGRTINEKIALTCKRYDNEKNRYSHFRARILEVEWFEPENWENISKTIEGDVLNNANLRIRYVELVY